MPLSSSLISLFWIINAGWCYWRKCKTDAAQKARKKVDWDAEEATEKAELLPLHSCINRKPLVKAIQNRAQKYRRMKWAESATFVLPNRQCVHSALASNSFIVVQQNLLQVPLGQRNRSRLRIIFAYLSARFQIIFSTKRAFVIFHQPIHHAKNKQHMTYCEIQKAQIVLQIANEVRKSYCILKHYIM